MHTFERTTTPKKCMRSARLSLIFVYLKYTSRKLNTSEYILLILEGNIILILNFHQPTRRTQWTVNPFSEKNPWWLYLAAGIPALLSTILIFLDQQITAVIVNRKENKLKVRYERGSRTVYSFFF